MILSRAVAKQTQLDADTQIVAQRAGLLAQSCGPHPIRHPTILAICCLLAFARPPAYNSAYRHRAGPDR